MSLATAPPSDEDINAHQNSSRVADRLRWGLAIALKARNLLLPSSFDDPLYLKPDYQLCNALNAPVTVAVRALVPIAARLECLVMVPARLRAEINEQTVSCWGYLSYPVSLAIDTVVYFGLVWLLWYATIIEFGGGGRSALAPKGWMRVAADGFAVIFGLMVVAYGLAAPAEHYNGIYWNTVAVPYYLWGLLLVIFYGRDLWSFFRPQKVT